MINPVNQKVFGYYIAASDLHQIELLTQAKMRSYLQFGYQMERTGIINPFNMTVSFESGKSFQKTSLELNYKYSYYGINNGLEIRLFTGTMLKNDTHQIRFMLFLQVAGAVVNNIYIRGYIRIVSQSFRKPSGRGR